MFSEKIRTALLGLAFLIFIVLSYVENTFFFQSLSVILTNQFVAVVVLFIHNLLVISLILLGMTFYVNLVVLNFFKREKYGNIVLEHPKTFALVFTVVIVFLSILRGSTLIYGGVTIETLPLILLFSTPVGIVEGYGIYLTIERTLRRAMSMKDLAYIYGIFLFAAIMEVGFINLLILVVQG
ncbi:MAG: hypothetical protein ACUVQX_05355 [Candidatus Bathycorpusculaceae bacterium]